ncbi:MAG: hypothetical protein IJU53_02130 [Thermoguttaceae bacterium]|nr:hypothetical protein [Thermoguttaceae bacterium]
MNNVEAKFNNYHVHIFFEVHYYLKDNQHVMDAEILNHCERELLRVIRKLSFLCCLDEFRIETEALKEGGIRQLFKFNSNNPYHLALFTIILTQIFTVAFQPLNHIIKGFFQDDELREKNIQYFESMIEYSDRQKELDLLRKQKLEKEIENYELKNELIRKKIESKEGKKHKQQINKARSKFYQELEEEERVLQIGYSFLNQDFDKREPEQVVERVHFHNFVFCDESLPPIIDEEAKIEIISPVLEANMSYSWKGRYKGKVHNFRMKSKDFMEEVEEKRMSFQKGSTLLCHLSIDRKFNRKGEEVLKDYNILHVLKHTVSQFSEYVETDDGKKLRKKKKLDEEQGLINFGEN